MLKVLFDFFIIFPPKMFKKNFVVSLIIVFMNVIQICAAQNNIETVDKRTTACLPETC